MQESKLRELVSRYSEFINFPIYMLTEKEVEVPVEEEQEEPAAAAQEEEEDKAEATKDEDDSGEAAQKEQQQRGRRLIPCARGSHALTAA